MTQATLDRLQQGLTEQLYTERTLLAQLAAHLAHGAGYPTSVVPDTDGTMVYLSIELPTGTITLGLPPEEVRLREDYWGPAPVQRQTMRERAGRLGAFLDALS